MPRPKKQKQIQLHRNLRGGDQRGQKQHLNQNPHLKRLQIQNQVK